VVHPLVLERALEHVPAEGWQVRQTERGLLILVARPRSGFDGSRVRQAVLRALEQAGARVDSIDLSVVDEIPAGAAGKRPLVVTFRRAG